jgi:hypothetical protein
MSTCLQEQNDVLEPREGGRIVAEPVLEYLKRGSSGFGIGERIRPSELAHEALLLDLKTASREEVDA